MPDQPTSPNSARITAMLDDLSAQRQRTSAPPVGLPTRPTTPPPQRPPSPPVRPPMPTSVAPAPQPARPPMPVAPRPSAPVPPPPRPITPAPAPITIAPSAPKPATQQYSGEIRTMQADIGNITTGQSPASTAASVPSSTVPAKPLPPAPLAPQAPSIPSIPRITPPEPPASSGFGRKILYAVVAIGVIVAIFLLVQVFFSGSTTTPSPTPVPTSTATLAPSVRSLSSYFTQTGTGVELKNPSSAQSDFQNTLNISQPASQQALRIPVDGSKTGTLADFLELVTGSVPQTLRNALGQDWLALAYGQHEQFDTSGNLVTNTSIPVRLVLIGTITDISGTNQAMSQWETTGLNNQIGSLFQFGMGRDIMGTFSSSIYRNTPIRYLNLPHADASIDWAIVTASNGKNYLVIAGSREAIFFTIDQLMQ